MIDTQAWYGRVRELTLQLVRIPSITNSPGEAAFAWRLLDLLATLPYFAAHPGQLRVERTVDDRYERSNLYALVRGAGPQTVVLAGHYDVVGVENYGALQPWAFDPEALLPRLLATLEQDGGERAQRAVQDLKSGAFLPGRGALDMKSGLAAGIAVLERFAARPGRRGNLLFVATPDEEEGSHGMRTAARRLAGLALEWELQLDAAINLDASDDQGDGSAGQAVYLGTVGKLLPSVLLIGRETHAGSPFAGVNANLFAAEVTRRVECNVALVDVAHDEVTPPPVSLKQVDLNEGYNVTTPWAAWCYFNVLTHQRSPREVARQMVDLTWEALEAVLNFVQDQARRYETMIGRPSGMQSWQPRVLTFAELRGEVLRQDPRAGQELDALARRQVDEERLDTPALCRRLTEAWWARSGLSGPAAVVGFATLHYPRVHLDSQSPLHHRLGEATERQTAGVAEELGTAIRLRPFFPGISDMSFLGGVLDPADAELVVDNTPGWEAAIGFDYGALSALDLPVINVGPWGRDYHQRTERVYAPYAFGIVPELIWRIANDVLDNSTLRLNG